MNRTLLFTVLLAASAAAMAHDPEQHGSGHSIDKVNGGITAAAGQAYGDLSTVNGGIDLERGAQAGDVETVNGGIEAGDDVSARSVSTVNGGIRFGQRARIDGDVETVNGGIFIDRGGSDTPLLSPARIQRPSQTLLIATAVQKPDGYSPELLRSTNDVYDSSPDNADRPIFETVFEDGTENGQSGGWGKVAYRHGGRALAVMSDASVKSFRPGELTRKNFSPYY